eukprot:Opistho-2@37527
MATANKRQGEQTEIIQDSKRLKMTEIKKDAPSKPSYVSIPDNFPGYPLDVFSIPQHYENDVSSILIPHGLILDRIEKLAHEIVKDMGDNHLVIVCVLKGAHAVFADILEVIKRINSSDTSKPLSIDFIRVKSYHNEHSTGEVTISGGDLESFRGKNVLLVEDIIDTGLTMTSLLKKLADYGAAKLRVASLLVKRTDKSNGYRPDYTGFEIPDAFVVGYCLDYNEFFRDMPHICIISETGRVKYAS